MLATECVGTGVWGRWPLRKGALAWLDSLPSSQKGPGWEAPGQRGGCTRTLLSLLVSGFGVGMCGQICCVSGRLAFRTRDGIAGEVKRPCLRNQRPCPSNKERLPLSPKRPQDQAAALWGRCHFQELLSQPRSRPGPWPHFLGLERRLRGSSHNAWWLFSHPYGSPTAQGC